MQINDLSGTLPDGISDLTNLTILRLQDNDLNGDISEKIEKLINLTDLRIYNTNLSISDLNSIKDLTSLKVLIYNNSGVDKLNLEGKSALEELGITKAINADLTKITRIYVSGSKIYGEPVVRLSGVAGFITWDKITTYYVIDSGVSYSVGLPYTDSTGNLQMIDSTYLALNNGGLMDNEGNLILGATLDDVKDGSVVLKSGGTVITGGAIYTFDDYTEVGETQIVTKGNFEIAKNTTDGSSVTVGGQVTTTIIPKDSVSTINLGGSGSETTYPTGSTVTNNDGDTVYVIDEVEMSNDGTISSGSYITVPNGTTVVDNGNGTVTIPKDMVVTLDDEDTLYPGEIIFDTSTGKTEYVPISG